VANRYVPFKNLERACAYLEGVSEIEPTRSQGSTRPMTALNQLGDATTNPSRAPRRNVLGGIAQRIPP